jgi:epoxyqueuosine reductase
LLPEPDELQNPTMEADHGQLLHDLARERGLDLCGIARVDAAREARAYARFRTWVEDGCAGDLQYLMPAGPDRRASVTRIVPEARSVVVVARSYNHPWVPPAPGEAVISRYAVGPDYHRRLGKDVKALAASLAREAPEAAHRWYVDTGPVLERFWAQEAGLGWSGRNTCLIHPRLGSYLFLGVIITSLALPPDAPVPDRCGTCRACLDACPTGALVASHRLDARRCIATWTIEHRGLFPAEILAQLDGPVFGCDRCQEVCPHNRRAAPPADQVLAPLAPAPARDPRELLVQLLEAPETVLRGRALRRAGRQGLLRNLAPLLARAGARAELERLAGDPDEVVAGTARALLGEPGTVRPCC